MLIPQNFVFEMLLQCNKHCTTAVKYNYENIYYINNIELLHVAPVARCNN